MRLLTCGSAPSLPDNTTWLVSCGLYGTVRIGGISTLLNLGALAAPLSGPAAVDSPAELMRSAGRAVAAAAAAPCACMAACVPTATGLHGAPRWHSAPASWNARLVFLLMGCDVRDGGRLSRLEYARWSGAYAGLPMEIQGAQILVISRIGGNKRMGGREAAPREARRGFASTCRVSFSRLTHTPTTLCELGRMPCDPRQFH